MHKKAAMAIFLPLLAGIFYQDADALTIYFLRFTIADHEAHVTRNFNVVVYDHDDDHNVTLDIPDYILTVIEEGCKTSTLSFPGFYTCKSGNMTVDLYSKNGFIVTFV
ncbi:MAG: hypothetical protein ACE5J2_06780 [Nitrososphaerales archaeon]